MFKNLIDVTTHFSDKQVCTDYLAKIRWNGNVTCAHCSHDKVYELKGANKRYNTRKQSEQERFENMLSCSSKRLTYANLTSN